MENFEAPPTFSSSDKLYISDEIKAFLLETVKWTKFLAILGYIGLGFLALGGLIFTVVFSFVGKIPEVNFPMWVIGFVYLAIAVVYCFPVTFLYRFSVRMKTALTFSNQQQLTTGFENLKSLYRFIGIFSIVMLSLYVLVIVLIVPLALIFS